MVVFTSLAELCDDVHCGDVPVSARENATNMDNPLFRDGQVPCKALCQRVQANILRLERLKNEAHYEPLVDSAVWNLWGRYRGDFKLKSEPHGVNTVAGGANIL